jgi:ABC-2 type transport system ATP-binding protein
VTSPVVEIRGLGKSFRRGVALAGVDLDVAAGEIVALLGPSGAGKTTIVEICAGLRRGHSGSVRVLGTDPARGGAAWRARLGLVAQRAEDLGDLTVAEAVETVGGFFPSARSRDDVLEAMGLVGVRGVRCARLDPSRRRRLDLALGVVGHPELLLLDEPTTAFDPDARREFWSLIRDLNDDGTTILLTTHYVDEAEYLSDRVGVLAAGQLLEVGPPATIGGRGEAAVTVRWMSATGAQSAQTTEPTKLIRELSAQLGGEVPQLAVERPNLQDVYARMIERANLARTEQSAQLDQRRLVP